MFIKTNEQARSKLLRTLINRTNPLFATDNCCSSQSVGSFSVNVNFFATKSLPEASVQPNELPGLEFVGCAIAFSIPIIIVGNKVKNCVITNWEILFWSGNTERQSWHQPRRMTSREPKLLWSWHTRRHDGCPGLFYLKHWSREDDIIKHAGGATPKIVWVLLKFPLSALKLLVLVKQ